MKDFTTTIDGNQWHYSDVDKTILCNEIEVGGFCVSKSTDEISVISSILTESYSLQPLVSNIDSDDWQERLIFTLWATIKILRVVRPDCFLPR